MQRRFQSFGKGRFNSFGGGSRPRRASYPARFGKPQGGRRGHGEPVDINLFINKAKEQEQSDVYTSVHSFEDFNLTEKLLKNIKFKHYTTPMPIQDQAIGPIMEGKDLIGIANTGTGKTAAFLIPMLQKVQNDRNQKVFIVAPTRELALQINEELRDFSFGMNVYSSLLIGGTGYTKQINELRRNPNFIIGTPGRIKDMLEKGTLNLSQFQNVILDEVDLMVDIGFIKTVEYFISLLSPKRQSLFFSATVDGKVSRILQTFVDQPVTISVKKQETAEFIDQDVIHIADKSQKIEKLHDLLNQEEFNKVLVFGRTKWSVEKLSQDLASRGFKVGAIHGNKSQPHRQRVLQDFKRDKIQVLLATDVASRGLDIDNVSHVINFDAPETYDDYIHRIGRTGRANKKGIALTFV